jgi:hypothetical protein
VRKEKTCCCNDTLCVPVVQVKEVDNTGSLPVPVVERVGRRISIRWMADFPLDYEKISFTVKNDPAIGKTTKLDCLLLIRHILEA